MSRRIVRIDAESIQCHHATLALNKVVHDGPARSARAVEAQRNAAREALNHAARSIGAPDGGWMQRPDGAPQPNDGWFWSISHKRQWAGAVVSRHPVGLDIEAIAPRRVPLFDLAGSDDEWDLLGERNWPTFFRLWTAKEATLKANGVGVAGLDQCRLLQITDRIRNHLEASGRTRSKDDVTLPGNVQSQKSGESKIAAPLDSSAIMGFQGARWYVEHFAFDMHVAAVAQPLEVVTDRSGPQPA